MADTDNANHSYHKDGPLVICILPDGKKVQFHKNSQPMDENDSGLKNVTDPALVQLCAYSGRLGSISEVLCDREMCLEAVKRNGNSLPHVSEELRDREICLTAVRQDGRTLLNVPEHLRDKEICLEAVKKYGRSLQDIPEELKNDINDCLRRHYVPKHYKTVPPPEWMESSLLLEMQSYLREKSLEIKSCSFSTLSPKM